MSRRTTLVLFLALLLVGALAPLALAQTTPTKQVGLVIAFPDGSAHTEVVTVPSTATTFDALKAAKVTLESKSDSFGQSVCKINNTGCPATDCFCDPSKFWAFYHLNGNAWEAAASGVSGSVPADKAVEGFAWSGFDPETYAPTTQPPVYTFAQLVAQADQPVAIPEPGTMLLLGGGAAALAAYARRRQLARKRAA